MSEPVDRLSSLLERFRVRARLFHAGPLCGVSHYAAEPGRGFLHVLRHGSMAVTHPARCGAPRRLTVDRPTLLFYPRPLAHDFHQAPAEGSDFACASLDFDGGESHPLLRALPPLVALPLEQVPGLSPALDLLFTEADVPRCGTRVVLDRLFEVVLIQLLRWIVDHPAEAGVPPGLVTGLSDPRLARVLVAVHESPGQPWDLPSMAACAGLSRSAFAALFRERVGQTPADYLACWRLVIAQLALREGRPLKQIADELGYAHPSTLSRLFARKGGTTARDWRRALRTAG